MELFGLFKLIVFHLLYVRVTLFSSNQFPAAADSCFQQTSSDKLTLPYLSSQTKWQTNKKIFSPDKYYYF